MLEYRFGKISFPEQSFHFLKAQEGDEEVKLRQEEDPSASSSWFWGLRLRGLSVFLHDA